MSDNNTKKILFILDGASFAYRSYYAIQRLSNSSGFPTNAVFGFLKTLKKLISDFNPEYITAVFDPKGPTQRHAMYDKYKIHRKPMPDDLVIQMPVIKELLKALNIPYFEIQGYEGDDVMATIAKRAEKEGFEVMLATGDKDMFQLVTDRVKVLHTHKNNETLGANEVVNKFGITPEQFIDYLALAGDTSDNVPGIPGIGEKTALQLIRDYVSVEGVYENIDKIAGDKRREKIKENRELAEISRQLVTLDTNVPLKFNIADTRLNEPDINQLADLYRRLDFRNEYEELLSKGIEEKVETDYRLVNTQTDFNLLLEELRKVNQLCIDTETTSPSAVSANLVGISFSFRERQAFYIPFNGNLSRELILSELKNVLENPRIKIIGQNIKYDFIILKRAGIELKNLFFDTMIAAYLIDPSKSSYNLASLAGEYLRRRMTSINELIGEGKKQITMEQVPIDMICRYSCADSEITFSLKNVLSKELERLELESLFREIEMPLVRVLADMEIRGVKIDTAFLKFKSREFQAQLNSLQMKIYQSAGEQFNINSPKQLSAILFDKFKLPVQRKTKTGVSTDTEVLEKLSLLHELPKLLLEYRQLAKLKSTYIDALPELVNPETGRIHTSFNQTITTTGRLSSSDPNLQNIPVRTEEGKKIREAFIPSITGWKLLSADYSQIELRVFAHLANETEMIKAFINGEDIHKYTASLIYGIPIENVTEEMRYRSKAVNFGIIYGQQAYGLSTYLKISVSEAQRFIEQYLDRYPNVKRFMDETIRQAKEKGFVTTIFGRRRYIPELSSSSRQTQQLGERLAVNTPIQGSAADIIKIAMIRIPPKLSEAGLEAQMILQIHDELLFECPENEIARLSTIVKKEMESVAEMSVPLKVDIKTGYNWKDI